MEKVRKAYNLFLTLLLAKNNAKFMLQIFLDVMDATNKDLTD